MRTRDVDFGVFPVQEARARVMNAEDNGWKLESWQPVQGTYTNENNIQVVLIAVFLTRELANPVGPEPESTEEEPAAKRGRPAKVVEEVA